jgi:hypothetical protein
MSSFVSGLYPAGGGFHRTLPDKEEPEIVNFQGKMDDFGLLWINVWRREREPCPPDNSKI